MKKFKHIITERVAYPFTTSVGRGNYTTHEGGVIPAEFIENSKDWVEITKPEYTILSFKYKNHDPRWSGIWNLNGKFYVSTADNECVQTLNEFLEDSSYEIHSVRRLSDNVEFKVGDIIKHKTLAIWGTGEIKEFLLTDNLYFYTLTKFNGNCGIPFNMAKKVEKLFTTEDGVHIYLQDNVTYFEVGNNLLINTVVIDVKEHKHFDFVKRNSYMNKIFSTKEKANEYLLMNKPCLSLNDIKCSNRTFHTFTYLKELVKTKL